MQFATATLTIRQDDTYDLIQQIIDAIEDEYGCDAMECAGVDQQELFDAILNDAKFKKMVVEGVQDDGLEFLTNCYDNADPYFFIDSIPGLRRVMDLCYESLERLEEQPVDEALEKAIAMVKKAGYRLC